MLAVLLIIMLLNRQVAAGPVACAACFASVAGVSASTFGAASACFSSILPHLVCGCLLSLGVGITGYSLYVCLPICFAPTP